MNNEELKKVLEDPKRILNIARVFHGLLHTLDKMEEEKAKGKTNPGLTGAGCRDTVEVVLKDKEGNVKARKDP